MWILAACRLRIQVHQVSLAITKLFRPYSRFWTYSILFLLLFDNVVTLIFNVLNLWKVADTWDVAFVEWGDNPTANVWGHRMYFASVSADLSSHSFGTLTLRFVRAFQRLLTKTWLRFTVYTDSLWGCLSIVFRLILLWEYLWVAGVHTNNFRIHWHPRLGIHINLTLLWLIIQADDTLSVYCFWVLSHFFAWCNLVNSPLPLKVELLLVFDTCNSRRGVVSKLVGSLGLNDSGLTLYSNDVRLQSRLPTLPRSDPNRIRSCLLC